MAIPSPIRWNTSAAVWLAVFLITPILMAACGKKGPPRLPDVEAPPGVRDLSAAVLEGAIVLKWTAPGGAETAAPAGYHVYRSAEPMDAEACEGCPVLFRRAAQVPLAAEAFEPRTLEYREPLIPGTRYRFKVVPYDAGGRLGPDSNVVRLVTE